MPHQPGFSIRADWGENGVRTLAPFCDIMMIVDVLSFSTAVNVACARGARVYPFMHGGSDAEHEARGLAQRIDGVLAMKRDPAHPTQPSLSPVSLTTLLPGTRLVLPSPNGSALTLEAARLLRAQDATPRVFAACLRNAEAVAEAVFDGPAASGDVTIGVIAAGERWPDGSLRPAIEDALGAGLLLEELAHEAAARGMRLTRSPEAGLLASTFTAARAIGSYRVAAMIRDSVSGRELIEHKFGDDVSLSTHSNVSTCVPALVDGAFVDTAAGNERGPGDADLYG